MQQFAGGILNALEPGIAKFRHNLTVQANQMIVLTTAMRPLVQCLVLTELMTFNQFTLHKQIQRIVDRRTAYGMTSLKPRNHIVAGCEDIDNLALSFIPSLET